MALYLSQSFVGVVLADLRLGDIGSGHDENLKEWMRLKVGGR